MSALWLRAGDADDYRPFDDIEDVAEHLGAFGVTEVEWHTRYGLSCSEFRGHDYISLYWAVDVAYPDRELTADEIEELNICLQRVCV